MIFDLRCALLSVLTCVFTTEGSLNAAELRFATFPDVSADSVVFSYRDAIWVAPVTGGTARLFSDVDERPRHPKFSPDGQVIAYTATVDDNTDVYSAPILGGSLKRLTHHPARDDMLDWYPDGKSILFKSNMESPHPNFNRLFQLDAQGGLPRALPLPYGESASISSDQSEIFFTYLRDFQEEVWKRYYGGRAPDIWALNVASGSTVQLTDHQAPDSEPMAHGSLLYFLSERGPEMRSNLWRLDRDVGSFTQVTKFSDADVRHPSIGAAGIVFDVNGSLFLLNLENEQFKKIPLDIEIAREELELQLETVGERLEHAVTGSPEVIVMEARGDVFTYNTKANLVKNITNTSQFAERYPELSPDGTRLAYFSDQGGEYQLIVRDVKSSKERQLTEFSSGFRYRPFWSPDGRFIAFMDHQQKIWLLTVENGDLREIDQGKWRYHWDMPNFRINWSPDSRWMTWSRGDENRNQAIFLYDINSMRRHQLTSAFYSDFDPVFDPSGNYLAALGYRSFSPTFGDIDSTFTYADSMVVSLIALTSDVELPGLHGWSAPEQRESVTIDLQDAEARLVVLPLTPGRYSALAFQQGSITVAASNNDGDVSKILQLNLGSDTPETLWEGPIGQVLDAFGNSTVLRTRDDKVIQVSTGSDKEPLEIQTDKLYARIDRRAEFLQMFDDSWRYQRDFYYDPGLHGVDWLAIKEHYRPLAAAAYSNQELTAIVREMHGELAAGHVYVSVEPEYNRRAAKNVGLLGVDFDVNDNAYQFRAILEPGVRQFQHRSPLAEPSLGVSEGNYLLAVNGLPVSTGVDPWEPFVGLADQLVELTIADSANGSNARNIQVKTMANESKLRELVWVEENRQLVEKASDGKIGYIYVPDMGRDGLNELMQMYRAQYHMSALIIDERFNRGGALGDRFVELLNRPPLNYFRSRNGNDYPLPELAHRGPKAMLINSWSYSGGDGFPFLFKAAGVGPLIGTRTWGGLIGPGMRMSLINGGFISAPPQRVYDVNGQWAEGNEGVKPNIPVLNNPGVLAQGHDQQIDRAVDLLMQELDQLPPISVPDFPDKTPFPENLE